MLHYRFLLWQRYWFVVPLAWIWIKSACSLHSGFVFAFIFNYCRGIHQEFSGLWLPCTSVSRAHHENAVQIGDEMNGVPLMLGASPFQLNDLKLMKICNFQGINKKFVASFKQMPFAFLWIPFPSVEAVWGVRSGFWSGNFRRWLLQNPLIFSRMAKGEIFIRYSQQCFWLKKAFPPVNLHIRWSDWRGIKQLYRIFFLFIVCSYVG